LILKLTLNGGALSAQNRYERGDTVKRAKAYGISSPETATRGGSHQGIQKVYRLFDLGNVRYNLRNIPKVKTHKANFECGACMGLGVFNLAENGTIYRYQNMGVYFSF
jgi:hypothetical protein